MACCCFVAAVGHWMLLPLPLLLPGAALPSAKGSNTCCCTCWGAAAGRAVLLVAPPSCRPAKGSAKLLACAGRMGAAPLPPNAQLGCAGAAAGVGWLPMGLPDPTRPASPNAVLLGAPAEDAGGHITAGGCCSVNPARRSVPLAAGPDEAAGTPMLLVALLGPIVVAAIQSLSAAAGAAAGLALPLAMPPAPLPASTAPPRLLACGLPSMPPAARLRSTCDTTSRTVLMAVANCCELRVGTTSSGARVGSTRSAAKRGPHCAANELPKASTHMVVAADLSTAVTCKAGTWRQGSLGCRLNGVVATWTGGCPAHNLRSSHHLPALWNWARQWLHGARQGEGPP